MLQYSLLGVMGNAF